MVIHRVNCKKPFFKKDNSMCVYIKVLPKLFKGNNEEKQQR